MRYAGAVGRRERAEFSPAMVAGRAGSGAVRPGAGAGVSTERTRAAGSGAGRAWLRALATAGPWLRCLAGRCRASGSSRAGAHGPGGSGPSHPSPVPARSARRGAVAGRNRGGGAGRFRRLAASLLVTIAAYLLGALTLLHVAAANLLKREHGAIEDRPSPFARPLGGLPEHDRLRGGQAVRARAGWAWCAVAGLLLLTTLAAAPAHAQTGICGRTAVVQTALLAKVAGVSACANVTSSHLAAIDKLDLSSSSINALAAEDFAGLTTLADLDLSGNDLATLPAGVFADLTALANLELQNNDLATLRAGVFAGLTALELLRLENNDLTTLPAGVFAGLTALVNLYLENNDLATLRAGVFADLTALTSLYLNNNDLATLPAGVFADLTVLTHLRLGGNPGAIFAPTAVARPDDGPVRVTGGTVMLDGSGSGGAWGANVTYSWAQTTSVSGVSFGDNASATPVVTIPALAEGTELIFTLTVTGRASTGSFSTGFGAGTDTARVTATSAVLVDVPPGTAGMLRARWPAPPSLSGVKAYHLRYRSVDGTDSGFQRVEQLTPREFLLRYRDPGKTYNVDVCTVTKIHHRFPVFDTRGPCSAPSGRITLPERNSRNRNDITVSLELPGGGTKATVAWDGMLTYRIRVSGVRDTSMLVFYTSRVAIAGIRLGPPGERIPEFTPYDSNSYSAFSYRNIPRKFIVWDSPTSGYWERTQTVWTGAGANASHVLELIDKPVRFFPHGGTRIGAPSSLCVEITDSSSNVTGPCAVQQVEVDPPVVTSTPSVSAAGLDRQWTVGETVEVTLAFNEAVEVDTVNGVPSVGIGLGLSGTQAQSAAYLRGSGTAELVFGYTLVVGDGAHTAMAVAPDSLALNGGAIRSVATGADAVLGHNGTVVSGGAGRSLEGRTARFDAVPADHDGTTAFTVELHFSAEPEGLSYRTVQGGLLEVEGGSVTRAVRATRGSNLGWRVTVAPSGDGDVQIQLPARKCGKPNAVCIGGRALAQAAEATVPGTSSTEPPPEVPLTASFSGAPAEHDGTSPFELRFRLSEEPAGLSYRTVHNGLFDVSGGAIGRAWRLQKGNNEGWGLRIEPSGFGDVTLTLRATTDCAGTPGVCASDGRMLGGGLEAMIAGPPTLAVADAEVDEGSGATLDFEVTLNRALNETVTVGYRTANGSASAGADYTSTSGTLTFAAQETSKTVSVPVLDDEHDEGSETLTFRLQSPAPARVKLADAEATGTINNTDAMPKAWLARFGRTVGEQAMEAVEARFEAARAPGLSGSIGGQQFPGLSGAGAEDAEAGAAETETRQGLETLAGWLSGKSGAEADALAFESGTLTGREVLTGSSFAFTGGTAETGLAAFWGRGAVTRFDGREGELTLDGEVASAMLGADFSREAVVAGLMVSHSRGEGGYRSPNGSGEVESTLTALFPYARYALSKRVSVWGMAGYGEGTLTLTPDGQAPMRPDMDLAMAALGVRGVLVEGGTGGPTLAVKSDAMAVRTSTDAVTGLAASEADVTRVRLALEGSQPLRLWGDAVLTPSLELGVRHDGGDAETGFGADIGAGLALAAPSRGLSAEFRARGLLTHEAGGMRERGVSGTLAWDPAPDSDRGLSLSLSQTVGAQTSGRADALLARPTLAGIGAEEDEGPLGRRLDARLGYGLGVFDDRWTATPELGLGLADSGTELRLGWRLTERVAAGLAFELGVEATRRESVDGVDGAANPEHGLGVGLGWRLKGERAGHAAFEMRIEAARRDIANDDRAPADTIGFKATARW